MKPFNKGGSGGWKGGKGGFNKGGRGAGGGWNDRGPRQMYPATCAECFVACEVPFRPNGKKPVLCRECMTGPEGSAPRESRYDQRRDDRPRFEKPAHRGAPSGGNEEILKQLKTLNEKMDEILEAFAELADEDDR